MINVRTIPCLLLKGRGLVKTTKFKNPNYIGDPINAVRIFNEKEVDELIFLDITATNDRRAPDFSLIETIAQECFMPFAYGGGIRNLDEIYKLLRLGVEKVVLNTIAAENPSIVKEAVKTFGSSTIIGAMDLKKTFWGSYARCIRSGRLCERVSPVEYAKELESYGIGELFVNSIDRDGTMKGYDIEIIRQISEAVNIPVIACGGAGSLDDIKSLVSEAKVSAAAAGSIFVYQGSIKGILINYPKREELSFLNE